ncbi:hypothetical protein IVB41_25515 [Bradyrhizobium sp. 44]|nr:hypothetical protein [Bradyrhizobium sp. 44]
MNQALTGGSEDPTDTKKTKRIMTVGLAQDW